PENASARARLLAGGADSERSRRAARQRRRGRSLPPSFDGADLPRHRIGDRLRRPPDGSGARRTEIPEFARDPDLFEKSHALWPESVEIADPTGRIRRLSRGILRLCPGLPGAGGARRGIVRNRLDTAT